MAGINRIVNTWFWNDPFVRSLNVPEKLIFMYFLTNSHTSICGIYEIPMSLAVYDIQVEQSDVDSFLEKAKAAGRMLYNKELGVVFIKNYIKFQTGGKPTFLFNANKQLNDLSFPIQQWLVDIGVYEELLGYTGHGQYTSIVSDVKEMLDYFAAAWNDKTGKVFPSDWVKGGKIMRPILKIYKKEEIIEYIKLFFLSNDKFIVDAGYSLSVFHAVIPKLIVGKEKKEIARRANEKDSTELATINEIAAMPKRQEA